MKTIMLYGHLGKKYGRVHRFDVKTPYQAIKLLDANFPTFRKSMVDGGAYKILIGGKESLDYDGLANPVSDKETIRIVPVVEGSGDNPAVRIIVGAVIMYYTGGAGSTAVFGSTAATSMAYGFGVSLVLGGISQLLFPPTAMENTDRPDRRASFIFNGAVNTTAQGNPVPVCYGQLIVGSQVISAGISTKDIPV